ncbi:hypothetical protein Scep_023671 [Stephania cephalantha]|uniref:DUF632 domain-containing protein n=1 Tax=Stephania cephalantha TaxID=152367 RepID=A0AAP0EW47_9MAGN
MCRGSSQDFMDSIVAEHPVATVAPFGIFSSCGSSEPTVPNGFVSSKVLHSITHSMPIVSSPSSSFKGGDPSSSAKKVVYALLEFDNGVGGSSKRLSSTLQKLYSWEKKVYEEVKIANENGKDEEDDGEGLKNIWVRCTVILRQKK